MPSQTGWGLLGNWEIGKYVPVTVSNFRNSNGPDGLGSFGKLGNWEICTSSHFPISKTVLALLGWGLLGNWEIGKWIGRDLFTNGGPVYKHSLGAPIYFPMLSPYLFINAGCVCKHGFGTLIVTQNVITYVNANTHTGTAIDIG